MSTIEYRHKGWLYRVIKDLEKKDLEVFVQDELNTPIPERLFKYYSLSQYSVEALTEGFLFAAHPRHFNDPYDCNKHIFDLTSTPLEIYTNYLKVLEESDPSLSISNLFQTDKEELDKLYLEAFWQIMYSKCGIVSLTDNPVSIQMWAYYSRLSGFQIAVNTPDLPKSFKGPIKVRYIEDFDKIPITEDLFLPTLYQITNKEINWKHESEWRFLVIGPNEMEVPFALFKTLQKNPHNRKFTYNSKAIAELTLGCYFFTPEENTIMEKNRMIFDLSRTDHNEKELKAGVLNFIQANPHIAVYMLFWEKLNDFILHRVPCTIERIGSSVYEMKTFLK